MKTVSTLGFVVAVSIGMAGCASSGSGSASAAPKAQTSQMYALAAPIVEGMRESWTSMLSEIKGERKSAHDKANERNGIMSEKVWLQPTPMGDMVVVVFEGKDIKQAMNSRMKSQDPHDKWFMSKIGEIHGMGGEGEPPPPNELVIGNDLEMDGPVTSYAATIPIIKGQEDAHAKFVVELKSSDKAAYDNYRRLRGIKKEYVWSQKTPQGEFEVIYWELKDPKMLLAGPQEGDDPAFLKKFTDHLVNMHGLDLSKPMPKNEQHM